MLGAGTYPRAARCLRLGSTSPRGRAGRPRGTARLPAGSGLPPGREGQRASLLGSSDLQGSRGESAECWDLLPLHPTLPRTAAALRGQRAQQEACSWWGEEAGLTPARGGGCGGSVRAAEV